MTIYKDSMTSVQIQLGYDITLMINNKLNILTDLSSMPYITNKICGKAHNNAHLLLL